MYLWQIDGKTEQETKMSELVLDSYYFLTHIQLGAFSLAYRFIKLVDMLFTNLKKIIRSNHLEKKIALNMNAFYLKFHHYNEHYKNLYCLKIFAQILISKPLIQIRRFYNQYYDHFQGLA